MAVQRASGLVLAALLILSVPAPAFGASASAAKKVKPPAGTTILIDSVTAKGSGCDKNSTVIAISPDNEAFTITYAGYGVNVTGGAKPAADTKNCKITIHVLTPAGYMYAVTKIDYRGFALVAAGASAVEKAKYHVQGTSDRPLIAHALPADGNYEYTDDIVPADQSWSKCGKDRKVDIESELRVEVGSSQPNDFSMATMDSTDGTLYPTTYSLAWKAC